jgi:hypothetical protein
LQVVGFYVHGGDVAVGVCHGGRSDGTGWRGWIDAKTLTIAPEQAGIAYDLQVFVIDKSTEEVSFILNYPNGLPTSGTSKDGTDDTDLPTTTIKQDPEAEFFFKKVSKMIQYPGILDM